MTVDARNRAAPSAAAAMGAALAAFAALGRRLAAGWRGPRARSGAATLAALDDRTLRDLGFSRDEAAAAGFGCAEGRFGPSARRSRGRASGRRGRAA